MRVRGFCCGWIEMDIGGLLDGQRGLGRFPVPVYVVEHAGSLLVFDSGLHPDVRDCGSERSRALGDDFVCDLPEGTDLLQRLRSCEIDPDDVDLLVLSHLHFDHVGGSALLADTEVVVQRAEWLAAEADVEGEIYVPADIDADHVPRLIDGQWDVFGDGRVTVIPTTGHTAGHQSLLLRTDDGGELVLCGDACYLRRALESSTLPPQGFDLDAQRQVFARLITMGDRGAQLVFGHEPQQWPDSLQDDRIIELSSGSTT
jgi:N-acyl homoserine lactone hydrolase